MSRFENIVQAPSHDRWISHQLHRIPCGRCHYEIEYGRGTEWRIINELVNEHWKTCPGKPHERLAHMACIPTSPPDATIVLSPPEASTLLLNSSNAVVESAHFPNSTWRSSGCERKRRTLEQRKLELEQDEYARNITAKSVLCGGCKREISLDKRSKYYPGLWLKHKGKCRDIENLERAKASLKVPQGLHDTRQVACGDSTVLALTGSGCADWVKLGHAGCYGENSTLTAHRLVQHYDSDDLSSEDEDEDGDLLLQEPFPTLNGHFYWSQHNHSAEWTYRYATKEEITTNLFHGQDQPYVRPDTRPFTPFGWQAGGRCGAMHCIMKSGAEQAVSHPNSFGSTNLELGELVAPHTLAWQDSSSNH